MSKLQEKLVNVSEEEGVYRSCLRIATEQLFVGTYYLCNGEKRSSGGWFDTECEEELKKERADIGEEKKSQSLNIENRKVIVKKWPGNR